MEEFTEQPKVHVGFYDSEVGPPVYDDTVVCPICNKSLENTNREIIAILIHCTRWPLCTFLRMHKDEINIVNDGARYNEIIVEALYERARIEQERITVPDVIRKAFT